MYDVEINNSQNALQIDTGRLKRIAERTLAEERVAAAEISIALVDNSTIHRLNRRHLDHDYETDVLSFILECDSAAEPAEADSPGLPRGAGKRIEGEVIASAEMAVQTGEKFGWSPSDELVLYVVHGLLHLCGYDDLSDSELEVMRRREQSVLKPWGLTPHYASPHSGGHGPSTSGGSSGVDT